MKKQGTVKLGLLFCMFTKIYTASDTNDNGYDRYVQFNEYSQKQGEQAQIALAKLNRLKSISPEYPHAARMVAESYTPEIEEYNRNSQGWFPSVNSERLLLPEEELQRATNAPRTIKTSAFPWSSEETVYKKGSTFDRIPNAIMMNQVIKDNNLHHLAIAQKSIIKDRKGDWIVATIGVHPKEKINTASRLANIQLANSLSVDEIKDLIIFAQETGFIDWKFNNMNMIRDKHTAKLTIIDTENGSLYSNPHNNDDRFGILDIIAQDQLNDKNMITRLTILKIIKEKLGINLLEQRDRTGQGKFEIDTLDIKSEVRSYINDQINILSQKPQELVNLLSSENNRYKIATFDNKKAVQELQEMQNPAAQYPVNIDQFVYNSAGKYVGPKNGTHNKQGKRSELYELS